MKVFDHPNHDPVPAVVAGLGTNGLGVVRSLGRMGVPVVGVYGRPQEAGRFSRYCRPVKFPVLEQDEKAYLDGLLRLGEDLGGAVLFPTSDEALQLVSHHRTSLGASFRFAVPDVQTLDLIISKSGTQELAERCGVPIPPTSFPQKPEDIEALCGTMRFPCIIKPLDTFSVKFPDRAKNAVVAGPDDMRDFFQRHPYFLGQTVIQEIVRGGDGHIFICAAYFDADSEPLAIYTGRKIRQYPPDYGVTCLGESVYMPELAELTVRFLKQIKFRGLVAAEYVRDRKTGAYYFLEMNARSYYHNMLFTDCGVNLAYVAYRDLLGDTITPQTRPQREGIWWLDFQRDLSSCWRKHKKGEITWGEWFRTIIRARSFAYLDRRDVKPYFYSVYLLLKILLEKAVGAVGR
jgi:predicted ATP-grasp superfamily ATP-dependent carboligase